MLLTDGIRVKDKGIEGFTKNPIYRRAHGKTNTKGGLHKTGERGGGGGLGQFADLRGDLAKKRGVVFVFVHSMKSVVDHSWQNHNSAPLCGKC